MFSRRVLLGGLMIIGVLGGSGIAIAKVHRHHDAHGLLAAKLHQNGKHQVAQIGNNPVTAEVSNNKVVNMSAGNLPVRKVRSKNKMAGVRAGLAELAAADGEFRLAQAEAYYYGYCFDAGDAWECYWYPAADVVVTDGWVDYVPTM